MQRTLFPVAAHLFLVKDGQVLLLRRANTGYEDGNYSVPAGHLDGGEDVVAAMQREALEEVGLTLPREALRIVQVMHRKTPRQERIDYFFECTGWPGEATNTEPHKCDELRWAPLEVLPENTVGYVRAALDAYRQGTPFTLYGWD